MEYKGIKYKVGMCVKVSTQEKSMPWYTEKLLTITGFRYHQHYLNCDTILVDRYIAHGYEIHPCNVFRDDKCIKMERKKKLEAINEKNR